MILVVVFVRGTCGTHGDWRSGGGHGSVRACNMAPETPRVCVLPNDSWCLMLILRSSSDSCIAIVKPASYEICRTFKPIGLLCGIEIVE